MLNSGFNIIKQHQNGCLYEKNSFLVIVLSGTSKEMGQQYGALMHNYMAQVEEEIIEPNLKSGTITEEDIKKWAMRVHIQRALHGHVIGMMG